MKLIYVLFFLLISQFSFAGELQPSEDKGLTVLTFVTDMKTFSFAKVTARVFTTASFAEPDETVYLVLVDEEADPSDEHTAVYDLDSAFGPNAFVKGVEKKSDSLVFQVQTESGLKSIKLQIKGLKVLN